VEGRSGWHGQAFAIWNLFVRELRRSQTAPGREGREGGVFPESRGDGAVLSPPPEDLRKKTGNVVAAHPAAADSFVSSAAQKAWQGGAGVGPPLRPGTKETRRWTRRCSAQRVPRRARLPIAILQSVEIQD
jgi:hypothetical protein